MKRAFLFAAVLAFSAGAAFVACSTDDGGTVGTVDGGDSANGGDTAGSDANGSDTSGGGSCAPGAGKIVLADWSFSAADPTQNGNKGQLLSVHRCDSVVWANRDNAVTHSVVNRGGSFAFNTGEKTGTPTGVDYPPIQFTQAGVFDYECGVHGPMMTGEITVVDDTADAGSDVNVADTNVADTNVADTNVTDAGVDANCVLLTVKDVLNWCSVSIDGGSPFTSGSQTICADRGGTVNLSAAPLNTFILGPAPWHDTTGDVDGGGELGTVVGDASLTTIVVGDGGTACAWVCCPESNGTGCPTTDQCP